MSLSLLKTTLSLLTTASLSLSLLSTATPTVPEYNIIQTLQTVTCQEGWIVDPKNNKQCIKRCDLRLGLKYDTSTQQCTCVESTFELVYATDPKALVMIQQGRESEGNPAQIIKAPKSSHISSVDYTLKVPSYMYSQDTPAEPVMCLPPNPCYNGFEARYYRYTDPNTLATIKEPLDFDIDSVECTCEEHFRVEIKPNADNGDEAADEPKKFVMQGGQTDINNDQINNQNAQIVKNVIPSLFTSLSEEGQGGEEEATKPSHIGRYCSIPTKGVCEPFCWPTRHTFPAMDLKDPEKCAKSGCDCVSNFHTSIRPQEHTGGHDDDGVNYWGCECNKRNEQHFDNVGCTVSDLPHTNTHNVTFTTGLCGYTNLLEENRIYESFRALPRRCYCYFGYGGGQCQYPSAFLKVKLASTTATDGSLVDFTTISQEDRIAIHNMVKDYIKNDPNIYDPKTPASPDLDLFVSLYGYHDATKEVVYQFWFGTPITTTPSPDGFSIAGITTATSQYSLVIDKATDYHNPHCDTNSKLDIMSTFSALFSSQQQQPEQPQKKNYMQVQQSTSPQLPSCTNNGPEPPINHNKYYDYRDELSYQRNYNYVKDSSGDLNWASWSGLHPVLLALIIVNCILFGLIFGCAGIVYCRIHQLCCCKPRPLYEEAE